MSRSTSCVQKTYGPLLMQLGISRWSKDDRAWISLEIEHDSREREAANRRRAEWVFNQCQGCLYNLNHSDGVEFRFELLPYRQSIAFRDLLIKFWTEDW